MRRPWHPSLCSSLSVSLLFPAIRVCIGASIRACRPHKFRKDCSANDLGRRFILNFTLRFTLRLTHHLMRLLPKIATHLKKATLTQTRALGLHDDFDIGAVVGL